MLYNNELIIKDAEDYENVRTNILPNLTKNLNGRILTVVLSADLSSAVPALVFEGFNGGDIRITGKTTENIADLTTQYANVVSGEAALAKKYFNGAFEFRNCSSVKIDNLCFADNDNVNGFTSPFTFKNCKSVFITNFIGKFNHFSNITPIFDLENTNLSVTDSYLFFDKILKDTYKGIAKLHSRIYIDTTVTTFFLTSDNSVELTDNIFETPVDAETEISDPVSGLFKKFKLKDNSMITWLSQNNDVDVCAENSPEEFQNVISELSTTFIGNHLHKELPYNFNIDDTIGGLAPSSIVDKLPVGATFYWPRAWLISGNIDYYSTNYYSTAISGTTFQTTNPKFETEYDKSLTGYVYQNGYNVRALIPFVEGAVPLDSDNIDEWKTKWSDELNQYKKHTGYEFSQSFIKNTSVHNSYLFSPSILSNSNFKILKSTSSDTTSECFSERLEINARRDS